VLISVRAAHRFVARRLHRVPEPGRCAAGPVLTCPTAHRPSRLAP